MSQAMKLAGPFWQAKSQKLKEGLIIDVVMMVVLFWAAFIQPSNWLWINWIIKLELFAFFGLFLYILYRWLRLRRNFSVSD